MAREVRRKVTDRQTRTTTTVTLAAHVHRELTIIQNPTHDKGYSSEL